MNLCVQTYELRISEVRHEVTKLQGLLMERDRLVDSLRHEVREANEKLRNSEHQVRVDSRATRHC